MLHDSHDPLEKNAQPSEITSQKWKTKIAEENAESALKLKGIIGTVANGRAGLGLYPQHWWSKESTINKRKIVLEEIHHPEEVRCIATAGGQRKQGAWTKWESARGDLKHMKPQKIKFPYKYSLQHLINTSKPSCLKVSYIQLMQSMWENTQPQIYSHWMRVCSKKLHMET